VGQFEFLKINILSEAVFRPSEGSRASSPDVARQIPRPAGEDAGHRDDAPTRVFVLRHDREARSFLRKRKLWHSG
jgi:hypothetical protein